MLSVGLLAFSFSAKSIVPDVFVKFARVAGILNWPRWTRIVPDMRGSRGEPRRRSRGPAISIGCGVMLFFTANRRTSIATSRSALPIDGYSDQNGFTGAAVSGAGLITSLRRKLRVYWPLTI